jgi:hypothetical protein
MVIAFPWNFRRTTWAKEESLTGTNRISVRGAVYENEMVFSRVKGIEKRNGRLHPARSGKIQVVNASNRISMRILPKDLTSTAGLGRSHSQSTPEAIPEVAEDTKPPCRRSKG